MTEQAPKTETAPAPDDVRPGGHQATSTQEPPHNPSGAEYSKSGTFQPRVEAEEGDPTRFDYVVLALITIFIVVATLWAFGIVKIPGLNL